MMSDHAFLLPTEQTDDGIVVVRLVANPTNPRGGVVVLDRWLIDAIDHTLAEVAHQGTPTGVVLASDSERVFVAGADLAEIDGLSDNELQTYLSRGSVAYQRLAAFACPTVAAVNGAALGGGLEIALHCDALIASAIPPNQKPWRAGLPEAGLGLCPGWGGTQLLPARIDPSIAIQSTATGQTFRANEVPDGLFDQVVPASELRAAALAWIRAHPDAAADRISQGHPRAIDSRNGAEVAAALEATRTDLPDSFSATAVRDAVAAGVAEGWHAALKIEQQNLIDLRHTETARARLDAFFAKA
jgi:enoyl-CoA hydratase/carnithine racemase